MEVFGKPPDFSNFDTTQWTARTNLQHREDAKNKKHRLARTKTESQSIERKSGVRYSVLLKLPYFDAPRMCIIDPMHNLFLGTAKKMIHLWKEELLQKESFHDIQTKVDSFVTPNGMGRLPRKIETGFAGFTAEQYKNWCLFFSLYALHGSIPRRHLQCWQLFCKACYFLCRRKVSISEVNEANTLLLEFCTLYSSLYGKEKCTINLHLHCHLADCVKDFGPVYAFWLFAYERFNEIMGSFHTNGKSISVQLMERFLDMSAYIPSKWPSEYVNEFLPVLEQFKYQQGSLLQNTVETAASDRNFVCNPLTPVHECCWQSNEIQQLEKICQVELNSRDCRVLMVTKRTKRLLLNNCYLSFVM